MSEQTKKSIPTTTEEITAKQRHTLFLEYFGKEPADVTETMRRAFINLLSRINPESYECYDVVSLSCILADFESFADECKG